MDEREMFEAKLVELSQRDEETFDKPFPNDDINVLWALWQVARRTTPDREAWISIEDRLPEEGQDVAFVVKAAKGSIQDYLNGRVLGGGFMIVGGHPTFTVPGVGFNASHWMPLPTAPGQTPTPSPRDTLIEEIAEMVDHMGEGRRLEEYVGAIREMKSGDKGGA